MLYDVVELEIPLSPVASVSTRQMWIAVADTYDAQQLRPLWAHQFALLCEYSTRVGQPALVFRAVAMAIAYGMVLMGHKPDRSMASLCYAYRCVPHDYSWALVQGYIEDISQAWEEIGQ